MVFDTHTRVWNTAELIGREATDLLRRAGASIGALDAGAAAHERALSCVSGAAVLGFRSEMLGAEIPNDAVAAVVRRQPTRLIGVAGVDPLAPDVIEELERCRSMGLYGVSISPSAQGFHPAHSSAMRLYERCESWGWPIFAIRPFPPVPSSILEFDRPSAWDEVARSFRKLRVIIGAMGWPWVDEAVAMAGKHPFVYLETSDICARPWQLYQALLSAWLAGVLDKVSFGSGFPLASPAGAIETLYSINSLTLGTQLPAIPRAAIRAVVGRDVPRLVGLPAGTGSSWRPHEPVPSSPWDGEDIP